MDSIVEIFKTVVQIAEGIIPIATCLAILIKPIRERLLGIKQQKLKASQKDSLDNEIHICLLRRDMRLIYNMYCKDKIIPERDAIDFFNHYSIYAEIGGNAWVDNAVQEVIRDWIVKFIDENETPTVAYCEALHKAKIALDKKQI